MGGLNFEGSSIHLPCRWIGRHGMNKGQSGAVSLELGIGRPNERGQVREVPLGTVAVVPFHKTVLCLSRKTQANRRPLPWDSKQGLDKAPVGISRIHGYNGIRPANRHRFRPGKQEAGKKAIHPTTLVIQIGQHVWWQATDNRQTGLRD